MDIQDLRRQALQQIVDQLGLANASRRFGKPDSQIKDMLAKRKSFGEKVARNMELAFGPSLPAGWLVSPSTSTAETRLLPSSNFAPQQGDAESHQHETCIPTTADISIRYESLTDAGRGYVDACIVRALEEAEQRYGKKLANGS